MAEASSKRDSATPRSGHGSARESRRLTGALGSAASSIVANTPRSKGSVSLPDGGGEPSRSSVCDKLYQKQKSGSLLKDLDIGMMNGTESSRMRTGPQGREKSVSSAAGDGRGKSVSSAAGGGDKSPPKGSPRASTDGAQSDNSDESMSSRVSIRDLRKSISAGRRGDIKGESSHVRLHLDDCTVDADKEKTAGRWKQSALTDFRQVCGASSHRDGLMQGLEMYGLKNPNRSQQHLIPLLLYFLGKHLDGIRDEKGSVKSCVSIQGPQSGKTSSVVLASLAVVDPAVQKPQAILLSPSGKLEINKFLNVLALTNSFSYQAFDKDETGLDLDMDPASPDVVAACTAHVLVGQPGRVRKALSCGAAISLDAVKILVVDDAHEFFHGSSSEGSALKLSGLPSGEKSSDTADFKSTALASSAIEDVVEICKMLDAAKAVKIPHIIMSEEIKDKAAKRMMKSLKDSMSIKKNLLSVENCMPSVKTVKAMKHYYAEASSTEWVRVFAGLVQTLTFPRALIYCDDDNIHKYLKELEAMGVHVSANLPGATAEARRSALADFSSNKTQFFLTHSEPAVCQIMLPKVSCVFHFGILAQLPSVYGVRLSPLDEKLKKESASILLVDKDAKTAKDAKAGDLHPAVAKLQKVFGISFMDMPLEMLPSRSRKG